MTALFDQTITVYRKDGSRQVLEGCVYQWSDRNRTNEEGSRFRRESLLLVPGEADLKPGDRVLAGIGPETVNWEQFLPVTVPTLSQLNWVRTIVLGDRVVHTEAGHEISGGI